MLILLKKREGNNILHTTRLTDRHSSKDEILKNAPCKIENRLVDDPEASREMVKRWVWVSR